MKLPDNFDFGKFRKEKPMKQPSESRDETAPTHSSQDKLLQTQFGDRFSRVLDGVPSAKDVDLSERLNNPNSIDNLYTTLNAELDTTIDLLGCLEKRIVNAIIERSGFLKSFLYYREISTLQRMYKKQQEFSNELRVLEEKMKNQIFEMTAQGTKGPTSQDIQKEFQTFRGTTIEKELQEFEKQFYSER